jgi:small subunit ribosomal protein S6
VSRPVRNYELVFIVHPEVDDEGLATVIETVKGLVERNNGQVTQVNQWGLRRLAYPIKKQWEGQYVLMHIDMSPDGVAELERSLGLAEQVIRHLVVRLDEVEAPAAEEPKAKAVEPAEEVVESPEPVAE